MLFEFYIYLIDSAGRIRSHVAGDTQKCLKLPQKRTREVCYPRARKFYVAIYGNVVWVLHLFGVDPAGGIRHRVPDDAQKCPKPTAKANT